MENVYEYLRTGVKNGRQHDQNEAEQHDDRNDPAHGRVVSLFKEFRQGRHAVLEENRKQQHRCNDQTDP